MPVKIFAAPGDHRDDFQQVEEQVNAWIAEARPRIVNMHPAVNPLTEKREHGRFMLTVVVHYEDGES